MIRYAVALAALALVSPVQAQTVQQCVCTAGCKIASDPFPLPPIDQPVSCTVYKMPGHLMLATGPVVLASTIPPSNLSVCVPADPPYSAGPLAGALACLVTIPAQAAGTTLTYVVTATNIRGETADSTARTFQSVQTNPQLPPVPLGPRVTP